jgi:hypothetical protein
VNRCRTEAADEFLAGTAPEATAWLAIEDPGPWGPAVDLGLDLPAGVRVILIRRRRTRSSTREVFLALPHSGVLAHWRMNDIREIRNLDLAALIDGRVLAPRTERQLTLVCTNGKRDQCCAIDGRALFEQVHHLPDVWECTHIGGHRFAPVVLHLPDGHVYGRVTPAEAQVIADGRVPPTALRGPSHVPAKSQAAIVTVRKILGETSPREVVAHDEDPSGVITVTTRTQSWRVVLRESVSPAVRPESCGGHPGQATSWVIDELTEIPDP